MGLHQRCSEGNLRQQVSSSPWADGRKTISELNKIACLFVVILNIEYIYRSGYNKTGRLTWNCALTLAGCFLEVNLLHMVRLAMAFRVLISLSIYKKIIISKSKFTKSIHRLSKCFFITWHCMNLQLEVLALVGMICFSWNKRRYTTDLLNVIYLCTFMTDQ